MNNYDKLNLGKRENAFYVKSNSIDPESLGLQTSQGKAFYIHIWDPEKKTYVEKLAEKGIYDNLG